MVGQEVVLDEIQWRAPDLVKTLGGIHENTVLHYFAASPFYDSTSNNASLTTQAQNNMNMFHLLETRQAFEDGLRSMQGLEFMVAMSTRDLGYDAPIGEGLWVIRKQYRRRRQGGDDITILQTYFVVGDAIYMAPAVSDIISSKVLSTSSALHKLLDTASSSYHFTPALGHRYFPMTSSKPADRSSANHASLSSTPLVGTPLPASQSQPDSTKISSTASSFDSSASLADTQALYESFNQFLRFGYEYMDENPLLGEPGSFVFSSSKHHLQAQQQAAQKREAASNAQNASQQSRAVTPPSTSATPFPPKVETATSEQKINKDVPRAKSVSGVTKPKRRKSRNPTSPSTPVSAASPT